MERSIWILSSLHSWTSHSWNRRYCSHRNHHRSFLLYDLCSSQYLIFNLIKLIQRFSLCGYLVNWRKAQTLLFTGASSGIGEETTRVLALRGVHVVMAVRNTDSGNQVRAKILKDTPEAKIDVMKLDLSSMASVRSFASEFKSLDLPLNLLM